MTVKYDLMVHLHSDIREGEQSETQTLHFTVWREQRCEEIMLTYSPESETNTAGSNAAQVKTENGGCAVTVKR